MVLTREILDQICLTKVIEYGHDCWGKNESWEEDKSAVQIFNELCELLGYEGTNDETD